MYIYIRILYPESQYLYHDIHGSISFHLLPNILAHNHTHTFTLPLTHTHAPSPPGSGWTTKETVRSLAYSILADLVHHIRTSLSLQHLSMAVFLFSKNIHDETLPVSIQTMSCKLLLNLVKCIRQKAETEPAVSRQGKNVP